MQTTEEFHNHTTRTVRS